VRLNQPYGERFWLLPFKHWQLAILRAPHYALYGAGDFFYTLHTLIRPFARFSEKDSSRPWDIALYKCRNYIKLVHFVFRASDPLLTFAWKAKFGNRSPLYYTLSKDYSSALDLNSNSFVLKPSFFIASLAKLFFQHIKHIIYLILTLLFVLLFSYTPHIAGDRRRFEAIKFKEYVRLEQEAYDQKRYKLRYLREAIEAFKRQKLAAKNRARNRSPVRFKTVVKKIRQTSRNLRKLLRRDITGIYKRERKWLFVQSLKMGRKLRRQVFQQIEREKRRKREDEERLKKRGIKLESESVNIPETCITAAVLVTPEELKKRAKLQKKKKEIPLTYKTYKIAVKRLERLAKKQRINLNKRMKKQKDALKKKDLVEQQVIELEKLQNTVDPKAIKAKERIAAVLVALIVIVFFIFFFKLIQLFYRIIKYILIKIFF